MPSQLKKRHLSDKINRQIENCESLFWYHLCDNFKCWAHLRNKSIDSSDNFLHMEVSLHNTMKGRCIWKSEIHGSATTSLRLRLWVFVEPKCHSRMTLLAQSYTDCLSPSNLPDRRFLFSLQFLDRQAYGRAAHWGLLWGTLKSNSFILSLRLDFGDFGRFWMYTSSWSQTSTLYCASSFSTTV